MFYFLVVTTNMSKKILYKLSKLKGVQQDE